MSFSTRCLVQRLCQTRLLHTVERKVGIKIPFIQELLQSNLKLITLLESKRDITPNDWKKAREDILQTEKFSEKNIDATISNLCFSFGHSDAFLSYIQFLKNNNYELNLYIVGKYISLISKKSQLTDSEKQEICLMYDNLRKRYSIFNGDNCERFIQGLCRTDRWKDSIELLDMIKMSTAITASPVSYIISAAFHNGKEEIGWKYFDLAVEENLDILPGAYTSYLEYCLKTFKDKNTLEKSLLKLFQKLKENDKLLNKSVLNDYLTVFKNLGYTHDQTTITRMGKCKRCSHQLPPVVISKEEFEEMSKIFMEKVVVGGNVYYNSSPKEFKEFMEFLNKAEPYDIVIDGLNVACVGHAAKDNTERANRLAKILEHFLAQKKRILLLGRKHMLRWKNMNFIKHNTQMFLVDDSSSDDQHLLYATLHGGLRTCFLSMDLMRQHKYQLPLSMRRLFKKWQISHQYMLQIESMRVKNPVNFEISAHEDENGLHVPYHEGIGFAKDSYHSTANWICLRKPSISKSV